MSGEIVFPFAISLRNGWDFGHKIETEFVSNQSGNNYHFTYLVSATISHSLLKNLDFFVFYWNVMEALKNLPNTELLSKN